MLAVLLRLNVIVCCIQRTCCVMAFCKRFDLELFVSTVLMLISPFEGELRMECFPQSLFQAR